MVHAPMGHRDAAHLRHRARSPSTTSPLHPALSMAINRCSAVPNLSEFSIMKHVDVLSPPGSESGATSRANSQRMSATPRIPDPSQAHRLLGRRGRTASVKLFDPHGGGALRANDIFLIDSGTRSGGDDEHLQVGPRSPSGTLSRICFDVDDIAAAVANDPTRPSSPSVVGRPSPLGSWRHRRHQLEQLFKSRTTPSIRSNTAHRAGGRPLTPTVSAYSVPILGSNRFVVHAREDRGLDHVAQPLPGTDIVDVSLDGRGVRTRRARKPRTLRSRRRRWRLAPLPLERRALPAPGAEEAAADAAAHVAGSCRGIGLFAGVPQRVAPNFEAQAPSTVCRCQSTRTL